MDLFASELRSFVGLVGVVRRSGASSFLSIAGLHLQTSLQLPLWAEPYQVHILRRRLTMHWLP